ncbi:periplasmic substrate-binding domain-containing protein [Halosimplex salinum]|uniref:hypothetical protein n=1 Tax=Halosimplex salinum TaxID=1710538 RepID=UPI0013DDA04D|nr:hypothetical protein [Halosimplex salinum]
MVGDSNRRDDVRNGGESDSGGRLNRRRFVSLTGLAASAGLTGCSNETDGSDQTTAPDRAGTNVVSVMTHAHPTSLDMGPNMGTPTGRAHFLGFLHSLVLPVHGPSGEYYTSGHTTSVGGRELSVPCAVDDYAVEDGEAVRLSFDDRLTYWNGEPLDGRPYYLADRIGWLETNGAFQEAEFGGDLLDGTEYRRAFRRGPTNAEAAGGRVHPGLPPLPPSYSEPWVERFEDATTRDAVQETYLDYRRGKLRIETFVEEGYGTGRYEVRSADDVTDEGIEVPHNLRTNAEVVYAEPRSDYPGASDRRTLRIVGGAVGADEPQVNSSNGGRPSGSFYDPRDYLSGEEVDFGTGVIAEAKGDFFAADVPDDVEQLATWPNPAGGGLQLTFNWENEHLRRLWVRRAIAAAAPLARMRLNQYGKGTMAPSTWTGMLGTTPETVFEPGFLDSLYDYPLAADYERAATWLRRAGYERVDGLWTSPEGSTLSLTLTVFSPEIAEIETLVAGLESFGVAIEIRQLLGGGLDYEDNIRRGAFDLLLTDVPGGWSPTTYYNDWFAAGEGWTAIPPIAVAGNPLGSCRDDPPLASVPESVTLPEDPGALAVDGVDYADGGATYEFDDAGETVSPCSEVERLRAPDTGEAGFREAARRCARWYNYALPNVVFVQDRVGLWTNRSKVALASDDELSLRMSRGRPTAPQHYHVQAGTLGPTTE